VDNMTVNFGGTGGNIAYNLAILGEKPMLMGAAGSDAGKYLQHLKKHKVDCRYVKKIPKILTAHASVMTDMDDNQITAFYMGAMSHAHTVDRLPSNVDLAIIAPNDIKAMTQYADEFRRRKIRFIADPGQAIPALSKLDLQELITGAYILVVNDYEWDLIREKTGWEMKDVLSKINYLIITYGENGSKVWRSDATMWEVPAVRPKEMIDPTGCGDAFRAYVRHNPRLPHRKVRRNRRVDRGQGD
jgi:adenosine kinase